ncbi:MAG: hypothetical protein GY841_00865, partial [FCB group bacterium]|nr:hypothetical protein [FCB group bacterium]
MTGSDWHRAFGDPVPLAGAAYFAAGGVAELSQDVDVAVFASSIDAAEQSFAFETFMHAATDAGSARLVVEFRDLDDVTVLDQYDSGVVAGTGTWQAVGGELTAPVGTRRIRVRLLAEGTAAFDRVALHSLGRLTLVVDDATVTEGNSGTTQAGFHLSLSCPSAAQVVVDYATVAGSATEGGDYVAPAAPLVFAAGEIEQTLTVDVL